MKAVTSADYNIITIGGKHKDKDLAYNVVFDKDGKMAGFNYIEISSLQEYFDAVELKGVEEEIIFGDAGFPISGTLMIPEGDGPFPAVVLVHGSGPSDRDESIYSNKPFKDISEGLLNQGIAVLKYDKRTFTHMDKFADPEVSSKVTIYDEIIDDAKYAIEFLKNQEAVDANKIFVVGHSLGGNQAPRIAEGSDVAGLVILAGNVTPLQNLILEQYSYILELDGSISEQEQVQLDAIQKAVDLISSDKMTLETNTEDTLGLSPVYWMDLKEYDPISEAKKLTMPILVMQGARDYQVRTSEFELWKQGFGDKAEYKLYEDLNHLFMTGEGFSAPGEYSIAGKVSTTMIDDLAKWILKVAK